MYNRPKGQWFESPTHVLSKKKKKKKRSIIDVVNHVTPRAQDSKVGSDTRETVQLKISPNQTLRCGVGEFK